VTYVEAPVESRPGERITGRRCRERLCTVISEASTVRCRYIVSYQIKSKFITFRVRHSRGEMYIGHARLCVCLSVCLSVPRRIQCYTDSNVTSGNGRGALWLYMIGRICNRCTGFVVYDNTHVCKLIALYTANAYSAEREMSANACTRSITSNE